MSYSLHGAGFLDFLTSSPPKKDLVRQQPEVILPAGDGWPPYAVKDQMRD